jgi:hypothetical protein
MTTSKTEKKKKNETNKPHSIHFFLFMFQIAFLVQLRCMKCKHIWISPFGRSHVSSPYLAQIVVDRPLKPKIIDLDNWCPLWALVTQKSY